MDSWSVTVSNNIPLPQIRGQRALVPDVYTTTATWTTTTTYHKQETWKTPGQPISKTPKRSKATHISTLFDQVISVSSCRQFSCLPLEGHVGFPDGWSVFGSLVAQHLKKRRNRLNNCKRYHHLFLYRATDSFKTFSFFKLTNAFGSSPVGGHPWKLKLLRSQPGMRTTKPSMRAQILTDVVKWRNQLLKIQVKPHGVRNTTSPKPSE